MVKEAWPDEADDAEREGALRFALIGSASRRAYAPAIHSTAFGSLHVAHVYEILHAAPDELPNHVAALRDGRFAGLNVTAPYTQHVLSLVDEIAPSANDVGAANTLVRSERGTVVAHNTEAASLRTEIERLAPPPLRDRSVLVLGTGGVARSAIVALASLGAVHVVVRGRDASKTSALRDLVRGLRIDCEPLSGPERERSDVAVVVQATSCGMNGGASGAIAADAVAWDTVPGDAVALDLVYMPRVTPFLVRARERGLASTDGVGTLVQQGTLALSLWLPSHVTARDSRT